ncbi:MAG TPA: hypothetical protein VF875_03725 [Anaeromyxobacter sp.]
MRLCQRTRASCGACCGLYNRGDPSRPKVLAELRRRTRALADVPRTAEAFRAAARKLEADAPPPLFPSVRVCTLLGLLDAREERVGCLAHPAVTGGPDLRDCGVYDARICESFLCPSFSWLAEEEAEIAEVATGGDPYLYGLVVTDVPFLRAVLGAVADGTGARVEARHLADGRFRSGLRRVLELKTQLAPGSDGLFGAFAAGPSGDEVPRRIDYGAVGRAGSRYDAILTCAGADPRSGNDLDRLEAEVVRRLDACVGAFPG